MKEYLEFIEQENPGKKTRIALVVRIDTHECLGQIRWYTHWRQYCFLPNDNTLWSEGCLQQIREKLVYMNQDHKNTLMRSKLVKVLPDLGLQLKS